MTNKAIARHLRFAADLLELSGENPFRARAYSSAARAVETSDVDVAMVVEKGETPDVPGVGRGIGDEIAGLIRTGSLDVADRALEALPPGLPDLLHVKGLGVKKVRTIWQELGVTDLEALEGAATSGALAALAGFGKKTAQNVLDELEKLRRYAGWHRYREALDAAVPLLAAFRTTPGVARADLAGAIRRQLEIVDRIEIVAAGEPEAIRQALASQGVRPMDGGADPAFFHGRHPLGLPVVVHHPPEEHYGRALWAATGDAAHVETFVDRFGMPGATAEESVVYTAAGLDPIPPPLRDGADWLDAAAARRLPDLLTVEDLRGTLHNHSTWSDGAHTIEEMAAAARERGLEYFALCDHSRSLHIANGLTVERLLEQIEEVAALNARYAEQAAEGRRPFRILTGTECDVLGDGEMDFPDDVLARLDFVVASIHSRFNMTEAEGTDRLIRAVENPYVDVLGHLTGRLLLRRDGYPVDHPAVIDACARTGTSLELNANPNRLDVDWRWLPEALRRGVMISINPDAHSTYELDNVRWGVAVAQKGGLTPDRCLNALGLDDLLLWLAARRRAAGVAPAA